MNREEFLSACGECEVGYRAQLLDFYRNYADIVSTINTLDENSEQKVLGFIHLYEYILKTTNDDFELIDQLFFIPGRFEREFQRK